MDKPQDRSKVSNEPPPFAGSGERNITEHQEGGRAYLSPPFFGKQITNENTKEIQQ